jgi:diadenosine tetraphosphatase ApaH/serine/threonine PP2A family protein phosphatase
MQRWVLGNHDAALRQIGSAGSQAAAHVIEEHRRILRADPELWDWCRRHFAEAQGRPKSEIHNAALYVFVHAQLWETQYFGRTAESYLYPWKRAALRTFGLQPLQQYDGRHVHTREELDTAENRYLFYGHTHMPTFCELLTSTRRPSVRLRSIVYGEAMPLGSGYVAVNPGSVGQPRDGDQRAAYIILDTDNQTVEFRRVVYDVESVIAQMQALHFPAILLDWLRTAGSAEDHYNLDQVYERTTDQLQAREP